MTPPGHLSVTMTAETHHLDPMLQEAPSKREPWSPMKEMTFQKTPQSPEVVVVITMVVDT